MRAMASVRQKDGSAYWFACYKLPTGKFSIDGKPIFRRVQRSTGTSDKTRAEQLATSFERAAILASERRWTDQSARQFLAEINALAGVHVAEVEPVDAFLQRWISSQQRSVDTKTLLNYRGIVADFIEFLGPRRRMPVVDATARVLIDFRDAEVAKGKSGTTVNKALSVLGQAFAEAVVAGFIEVNPARGVRVKGADKRAQKRRPFTFDQFCALVARTAPRTRSKRGHTVHRDWQTFILATGYTGGRQQETAQLAWPMVDFQEHRIGLGRTKNGDVHWLPLHRALEDHLRQRWVAAGQPRAGLVMPHIAAMPGRKLSRYFREIILPRVGISQPYAKRIDEKGAGRVLAAYSIHSLRHSLSTWLAAAGVDEHMRMQLIGHEDEDVSRGYTHIEMEQARAELAKVPSVPAA
jgi:integrase